MAAAAGRNCARCVGRLTRMFNTSTRSSTRLFCQKAPSSTRFVMTRSFMSNMSLVSLSASATAIDVPSVLVHIGGDVTIADMEDDEGNGRAKHR